MQNNVVNTHAPICHSTAKCQQDFSHSLATVLWNVHQWRNNHCKTTWRSGSASRSVDSIPSVLEFIRVPLISWCDWSGYSRATNTQIYWYRDIAIVSFYISLDMHRHKIILPHRDRDSCLLETEHLAPAITKCSSSFSATSRVLK